MLEELHITGLGVIDDALLTFGPGLTAVTGETGAGKTMVVTGLLLLFGGRADAARVRMGAERASVEGRLELPARSPVTERVRAAGGELDDDTGLTLRRVVNSSGRSRAYVGGAAAPVAVLTELAERLLTVHGQSDQLRLTRPGQQRAALDRFAKLELSEFADSYASWRAAEAALVERSSRLTELRREASLLEHGITEIDGAEPEPGEDVNLAALADRLAHADGLRLAARSVHDLLLGDADAPMSDTADVGALLGSAARILGQQAGADALLDGLGQRLVDVSAAIVDLGGELGTYTDQLDADPARLEQVQARRAVLLGLVRKYADAVNSDLAAVLQWREAAAQRLVEIDVSDEAIAHLVAVRDAAAARTTQLAEALSAARHAAAGELAQAVTSELSGLAMPTARVEIVVRPRAITAASAVLTIAGQPASVGEDGADEIEFLFQSHPDAPAQSIGKSASGGELSRVMLAVEVCLVGTDPVPTMIFDEVDAGVGGRAAIEVGRRLARLAREHQVIVVTHLAQVAAFADHQIVVDRPSADNGTVTGSDVHTVQGEERVRELARMLAGSDSAAARKHAAELLNTAAQDHSRKAAKTRS